MRIKHPTPQDTGSLRQLWQDAFGDPDTFLDIFFSTAFLPSHCLCLWDGESLLSAAYWLDCRIGTQTAAYLYAVATTKENQGKGHCRTLMTKIHEHLQKSGYCGSILVPGDAGLRQMYTKMGYADFGGIREFTCDAADPAVQIQAISADEFAVLRRRYLPEKGVIQEGKGLAFLAAAADFYCGKDYLLTFNRAQNRVMELLGNADAAPFIAKALGVSSITVRTPGSQPFAMYHPLDAADPPTYFAFAFD